MPWGKLPSGPQALLNSQRNENFLGKIVAAVRCLLCRFTNTEIILKS